MFCNPVTQKNKTDILLLKDIDPVPARFIKTAFLISFD